MEKVETKLNSTQGNELQVPCTNCAGRTFHRVLVSVDIDGEQRDGNFDFQWDEHYQTIQCQGCKAISFRKASSNSEEYEPIGPDEWTHAVTESIYPPRLEGRKGLGDDSRYLPTDIQRIYNETLQALTGSSPVLTGIGLRALVETVCKEKKADGANLFSQIDDLVKKNILTPAGANILHKIRTMGNAAAHEVKPHEDKQLGLAMDVVEHLLKDVYILPKQIEAEFK